ncbi:MAG: M18 family aminopeptidase [Halieaceae bacterium]|nr:M18 family aminopeptidase [Halieaceae bacterium]
MTQVDELLTFLREAVTPFHAVQAMSRRLADAGFEAVESFDPDTMVPGRGYFMTRQGSSLIALRSGQGEPAQGLRLVGAHTDSPNLSVKPNPVVGRGGCVQLSVDVYGGALLNPWFDRDLALAGRVTVLNAQGQLESVLFDSGTAVAVVPSLAIHLDREANKQRSINPQKDVVPLVMLGHPDTLDFKAWLAKQLVEQDSSREGLRVMDFELSLYDTQSPGLVGMDQSFIASARLDNLLSCYAGLAALIEETDADWSMLVATDHEEVGSASTVGAQGPMLMDALTALTPAPQGNQSLRNQSWMLSVDNAHAVHPNYADKHDDQHSPHLGGGPVIKINRNQRYATDSEGAARLRLLAERAGVDVQAFVMRADLACGSTIGPITATETGIPTTDLGVPTLAMHSIRELACVQDIPQLIALLQAFYRRLA